MSWIRLEEQVFFENLGNGVVKFVDGLNEMGVCYDDLNTDMFSLGNLILTPAGKTR